MEMNFGEELNPEESGSSGSDQNEKYRRMKQELGMLSEFRILQICSILLVVFLGGLAARISIGRQHIPVPLYALLCYFFVHVILSEYMKKYKAQEFLLQSLCLRYHYRYDKLLTERFSFCFSFVLLAAIQYAFLHTIWLDSLVLTYAPAAYSLFQLLFRYLGTALFKLRLHGRLMYQK